MYCWNCGTDIPDGRDRCPACGTAAAKPRGWLSRLLGWFGGRSTSFSTHVSTRSTHGIHTVDSLDALPSDVRVQFEARMDTGVDTHVTREFSYRGPDGIERTYSSLEDMPADVRRMFKLAQNQSRQEEGNT